jgi:hypothetical protein
MTRRAGDLGLKVRLMAKLNVRGSIEAIYPLPGNLNLPVGIVDHFLDFRLVTRQFRMTQHAFRNRGNARIGTDIRARMAINAVEPHLYVGIVRKSNRLFRAPGERAYGKQAQTGPSAAREPSQLPIKQECFSPSPLVAPLPLAGVHPKMLKSPRLPD